MESSFSRFSFYFTFFGAFFTFFFYKSFILFTRAINVRNDCCIEQKTKKYFLFCLFFLLLFLHLMNINGFCCCYFCFLHFLFKLHCFSCYSIYSIFLPNARNTLHKYYSFLLRLFWLPFKKRKMKNDNDPISIKYPLFYSSSLSSLFWCFLIS